MDHPCVCRSVLFWIGQWLSVHIVQVTHRHALQMIFYFFLNAKKHLNIFRLTRFRDTVSSAQTARILPWAHNTILGTIFMFMLSIVSVRPFQVILCGFPGGSPSQSAVNDPPQPADPTAITNIHCMYPYCLIHCALERYTVSVTPQELHA